MERQENSKQLFSVLWESADILRSKMDANEYKNYLLGIIFYKYLSDTFLMHAYDLIEDEEPNNMSEAQEVYEETYQSEDAEDLLEELKADYKYTIPPELTYTTLAKKAANNEFQREDLKKAFNSVEQSDPIFDGLFADVDLYSTRLGPNELKQGQTVSELIKKINEADIQNYDGDILGDAYEYLIGEFASETGKKAGEFYTPKSVSEILTRVALTGQENVRGLTVYDPAMGSGSLLLNAKRFSKEPGWIRYYGQELNTSTYNLARMNMFLHGVNPENQHLHNADTLDADWPTDEETNFDAVLMNPPYSAKWNPVKGFLTDPRFSDYGVLAPKSKADYAFLLHGFYHLKNTGTMAIVLPHGVLFRGAAEGKIRQKLLESGAIYCVIGLPANLFYNTSIPTCIVVLKKQREGRDVLFIDASKEFTKVKTQNILEPEHIEAIINMYINRENVDKHAYLATYDEVKDNDFNLNIPRYVNTFDPEPEISINDTVKEIEDIDKQIKESESQLLDMLKELITDDSNSREGIDAFIRMLGGDS